MTDLKVTLPHDWRRREYQRPLWDYLRQGGKRAVAVWHRRAGKDAIAIHWTTVAAMQRVGVYWHMLPTLRQGRRVVWDGITKDGRRVLDAFPDEMVTHRRNDEMKLELVGGSIWQVVGSDNYDALVGANPVGVVFSEWSLTDPAAWEFVRPILAENGGWALFIYTPRGRNHGMSLYEMAKGNPSWFCERLTVDDTQAISADIIDEERKGGMSEQLIEQEFFCSFDAPLTGAYYGPQLLDADKDKRIGHVAYDPAVPVETWWDLGIGDATAIWFAQRVGQEVHLIDYYETNGEPLNHYAKVIQDRPYTYSTHRLPHDARARELITGKTRLEVLESLLPGEVQVVPIHRVEDGIETTRNILGRCWFDREKCERGIEALRQYRAEEAEDRSSGGVPFYKDKPRHDWASHGADAFRIGAMADTWTQDGWDRPLEYPPLAIA